VKCTDHKVLTNVLQSANKISNIVIMFSHDCTVYNVPILYRRVAQQCKLGSFNSTIKYTSNLIKAHETRE